MHQSFAVKVGERVKQRRKQGAHFGRRQGALGKYLREILLGILHRDVEERIPAGAAFVDADATVAQRRAKVSVDGRLSLNVPKSALE